MIMTASVMVMIISIQLLLSLNIFDLVQIYITELALIHRSKNKYYLEIYIFLCFSRKFADWNKFHVISIGTDDCGVDPGFHIVGGEQAAEGAYPWMV